MQNVIKYWGYNYILILLIFTLKSTIHVDTNCCIISAKYILISMILISQARFTRIASKIPNVFQNFLYYPVNKIECGYRNTLSDLLSVQIHTLTEV